MANASAGNLSVTITAVDRWSAPLKVMGAAVGRTQTSVSRFGTGLRTGVIAPLERVAAVARRVTAGLSSVVPALGVLTAAGTVAGVARLADNWARVGVALSNTAYRVQTTVTGLHTLQGAVRLTGGSASDATDALRGLGDTLSDAVGGRNMDALQYFQLLGVRIRNTNGSARTAAEVLPEIADGIARIGDPRLQARVLQALGIPEAMLPAMRQGSAGLAEYNERARRLGVMNETGAAAATRLYQSFTRVGLATEGLGYRIAEKLAPVLTPMLERFAAWLANNNSIADAIERIARSIDAWVNNGGLTRLGERLDKIGASIDTIVQAMGGWETAIIALGAVLTLRLLAPLTGIVTMLARLTVAFARIPAGALALLGITGTAAAGVAGAIALTPNAANPGEREALDRVHRGEDAFPGAPPLRPDGTPEPNRSWLDRLWDGVRRAVSPRGGDRAVYGGQTPAGGADAAAREARNFFVARGWTPDQSAGLAAQIHHESRGDPGAVGDGGLAYGALQWHPDRQAEFRRFLGRDIRGSTFQEQLAFIQYELTQGRERAAGDALRATTTAAEAGRVASRLYVRPGADEAARAREAAARAGTADVMARRYAEPTPAPAGAAAAAPAGPPGAAGQTTVRVTFANAPPGTVVTTTNPDGSARVERAMPGGATP